MDGVGMGILLNVAETIASFLAERTGNNIFDKASGRRKIKKVLKEDLRYIQHTFLGVTEELFQLTEQYLITCVFNDSYYYSVSHISSLQEKHLWTGFRDYLKTEYRDFLSHIDGDYKEKLTLCVNRHNEALNRIVFSDKEQFQNSIAQGYHQTIMDYMQAMSDTLNESTDVQEEDPRPFQILCKLKN